MWQYYQTYYILKGEDYEDKYALLSTPTKLGVGLITKTAVLKPRQSPLCLHNAFMMGWFIVLCKSYCQSDTESTEYCSNRCLMRSPNSQRLMGLMDILPPCYVKNTELKTSNKLFFFFCLSQKLWSVRLPGRNWLLMWPPINRNLSFDQGQCHIKD